MLVAISIHVHACDPTDQSYSSGGQLVEGTPTPTFRFDPVDDADGYVLEWRADGGPWESIGWSCVAGEPCIGFPIDVAPQKYITAESGSVVELRVRARRGELLSEPSESIELCWPLLWEIGSSNPG